MHRVLVSACLLGEPVRFDGGHKLGRDPVLVRWLEEGRVVPLCPEVAGGLPVPRPPAEIEGARGALSVLAGRAKVVDSNGRDVTQAFVAGAEAGLASAKASSIRVAVLEEGSPSCGSSFVYDGSFSGRRVEGPGVTTALLREAGITVFSELEWAEADAYLRALLL